MALVYADIEIINGGDLEMSRRHIIGVDEIRRMNLTILVETGSYMLCINESIQEQLGLCVIEKRKAQLANGTVEEYEVVGPIEIKFKNRRCMVDAMVLKGDNEPLLGAIPLEDMDVIIHPLRQELLVNPDHPYVAQMKLKLLVIPTIRII